MSFHLLMFPSTTPLLHGSVRPARTASLSDGQVGQILARYHGEAPDLLAPSFQTYLSTFADHLEAGKYVLDEFGTPMSERFLSM
jgi:hypothetical protein